jgi:hypothetical protein
MEIINLTIEINDFSIQNFNLKQFRWFGSVRNYLFYRKEMGDPKQKSATVLSMEDCFAEISRGDK